MTGTVRGDESDSDSEEDWLATDSDTEEETAEEMERGTTESEDDSSESSKVISQRFGLEAKQN